MEARVSTVSTVLYSTVQALFKWIVEEVSTTVNPRRNVHEPLNSHVQYCAAGVTGTVEGVTQKSVGDHASYPAGVGVFVYCGIYCKAHSAYYRS